MLPTKLTVEHFKSYPPKARSLAVASLAVLRQLPLAFLPSLLRELIDYDFRFPAERDGLHQQLAFLSTLSDPDRSALFQEFASLRLSASLENFNWVEQPLTFTEQLSAYLWSTHQMEAFRTAATHYGGRLREATVAAPLPMQRLGIAVIGQGARPRKAPLFSKLREHGTHFSQIDPKNGLASLVEAVAARSSKHPTPYEHWYIDGGAPAPHDARLTAVSYSALAPVRKRLLDRVQQEVRKPGMGPEELRDTMARLAPHDLGMQGDPVLDLFQLRLLTEGSGTQIFSTTFAQWATREALRRAQPLTMLVRFAPRQRQRPMNELLSNTSQDIELDPDGSLVDADMASYYHWINQQRLAGAEGSAFLVWFEGQSEAMVLCSSLPKGTSSTSALSMDALLQLAMA